MFLCNIVLYSIRFTFTIKNIHNQILFPFWPSLFILSGAYWAPTDLGGSSSGVISFCLFILFMGFSRQEYWSGLPFPSPVDNVLSELSSMTHLSSVALQGMAHSFTELHKAVIHVIILVSFWSLCFSFWSLWDCDPCFFCFLMDEDKRLVQAS